MDDRRREPDGGNTTVRRTQGGTLAAIPVDVVLLVVYLAIVAPMVVLNPAIPAPVMVALGTPLVVFLPGYALVTALFPKRGPADSSDEFMTLDGGALPLRIRPISQRGLSGAERAVLGFATSLFLIPVFGLFLNATLGFGVTAVIAVLGAFTLIASAAAIARHRELPPGETRGHTVTGAIAALRGSFSRSGLDATLTVVAVACVLFAGVGGAFALTAPLDPTSYSEFYLTTQTDDGEYVMAGYPTNLTTGEPATLYASIENFEQERTTYTGVIQIQRVRTDGQSLTVLTRDRLGTFSAQLDPGETRNVRTEIAPSSPGENLRVTYLLYKGDSVPRNPTLGNAYVATTHWVNVSSPDAADTSTAGA